MWIIGTAWAGLTLILRTNSASGSFAMCKRCTCRTPIRRKPSLMGGLRRWVITNRSCARRWNRLGPQKNSHYASKPNSSTSTYTWNCSTDQAWPKGAEVFFAVAEDRVESKVSAGENSGRMLKHTGVVRSLTKASIAANGAVSLDLKMNDRWGEHPRVVALVVAAHDGGKILGAAMTTL